MVLITEKDNKMLNGSIRILSDTYKELRNLDISKADRNISEIACINRELYNGKFRKDTRYFDIFAEDLIATGKKFDGKYISTFDGHDKLFSKVYGDIGGVIITEERGKIVTGEHGKIDDSRIEYNTPLLTCDPVDRSSYLDRLIEKYKSKCSTLGELFDLELERIGSKRACLDGCTSSVTFLKDNMMKYSVILNFFTGEVVISYPKGVYTADINKVKSANDFSKKVKFRNDNSMDMLCYTKPGEYEKNRKNTHLSFFHFMKEIKSPGGPSRFNYLRKELQDVTSVGVIAHNGEKIQESLPNIVTALYSGGRLKAYKLYCDPSHLEYINDRPLTPNLKNSLYYGMIRNKGINNQFFNNRKYPGESRDTTIIVPVWNEPAITMMKGMVERQFAEMIV